MPLPYAAIAAAPEAKQAAKFAWEHRAELRQEARSAGSALLRGVLILLVAVVVIVIAITLLLSFLRKKAESLNPLAGVQQALAGVGETVSRVFTGTQTLRKGVIGTRLIK